MLGRMELFHAADLYLAAARTRYMRSAGAEKIRKIGYLRLARRIEYNRFAIGGRRGTLGNERVIFSPRRPSGHLQESTPPSVSICAPMRRREDR